MYFHIQILFHWFYPFLHSHDLTSKFHQQSLRFNLTQCSVFNEELKWHHKTNLDKTQLSPHHLEEILTRELQTHAFLKHFGNELGFSILSLSIRKRESMLLIIKFLTLLSCLLKTKICLLILKLKKMNLSFATGMHKMNIASRIERLLYWNLDLNHLISPFPCLV